MLTRLFMSAMLRDLAKVLVILYICSHSWLVHCGDMSQKHAHSGLFEPFDGKHIAYTLTTAQNALLDSGRSVILDERDEREATGRGMVIQDIDAPPSICFQKIQNVNEYPGMVPKVKATTVYNRTLFPNGTSLNGVEFVVGIPLFTLNYFLLLAVHPMHSTITWRLDYRYKSDFDDIVGHWQVMPHPHREGWTRLLYSCQIRLFPWIPKFVVTFFTKSALVDVSSSVFVASGRFAYFSAS